MEVFTEDDFSLRKIRRGAATPCAADYSRVQSLGSFIGAKDEEKKKEEDDHHDALISSTGLSGFKFIKSQEYRQIGEDPQFYACVQLIERVCENLSLGGSVMSQAVAVAKGLLALREERKDYTVAAISAFSLIYACRMFGIRKASIDEIVEVHRALGYRINVALLTMKMGFDAPAPIKPTRAEDYLGMVASRLAEVMASREGARRVVVNPSGYCYKLFQLANAALGALDFAARGGRNPRILAATSFYAAEVALAESDSRKNRKYLTQRDVALCVGKEEHTVREHFCDVFRPRWDSHIRPALEPVLLRLLSKERVVGGDYGN